MVGIGVEDLGVEEFVAGKFFDGELYIDTDKQTFKDLEFKRYSLLGVLVSLFAKPARDAISESRGLGGNLRGDGLQSGGTLVVAKGGELLLGYRQENPAKHVSLEEVLNALKIDVAELQTVPEKPDSSGGDTCTQDVCSKP